ncbi:MAG: rod-binding protein [Candidatus Caldatribacteriaceae bacterium]
MKITQSQRITSEQEERKTQRLQSSCQDFEAFLLGFLFKRAFQPIFDSSLFSSQQESWFREMWIDEVAKSVSHQNGIGVAKILIKQLIEKKDSM